LSQSLSSFLQGSKIGERIKKILDVGGLVPFELTVQILINGLIAAPSQVSVLSTPTLFIFFMNRGVTLKL
jgi:hypothetical protein